MNKTRLFVQFLIIFVHAETAWVTWFSLTWMAKLSFENIDPIVAGIAMGVPTALITLMFKICQQYLAEYHKSGVLLDGAEEKKIGLKLTGELVEN